MSKLSSRNSTNEIMTGVNMITMRDIPYTPIPINSIIKDSLQDDQIGFSTLNVLNKGSSEKKPKYLQSNSKQNKKSMRKRKKVRFKQDFIEEVYIESYKEYNQKMCYTQSNVDDLDGKRDCKKCLEKYCRIF
jgi:hypothetical protein